MRRLLLIAKRPRPGRVKTRLVPPLTPGQALLALASGGNATVVEFLLTNQERLLSVPGLLDRLMANPALQADQRGRILEVLERAALAWAKAAKTWLGE